MCLRLQGLTLLLLLLTPDPAHGKEVVPFKYFLLQQPAFRVLSASGSDASHPSNPAVPLVMRLLFQESERIDLHHEPPQGGDFFPLARSNRPRDLQEEGLQKVVLEFPKFLRSDFSPGVEAWLVFQLRQSYILDNNCTQELTVYVSDKYSLIPVTSVSLTYKTGDPLLVVNITASLRRWGRRKTPRYVVIIKDSTRYTRDKDLYSFANYIDCTLARACEVLELHDARSSPVLLTLAPQLATVAAENLMDFPLRYRRDVSALEEYSATTDHYEETEDEYCHLREWDVSAEQMGWDWLVFPERVPLNLCVGRCPDLLDRHYNATSHAVLRGFYRMWGNSELKNTEPCCVPVTYRRFSLLVEKAPGVVSLELSSDLQAAMCGCR